MKKQFILIILTVFFSIPVFSQTEKYAVSIQWELYRVSEKKVSLLFPKLPVFFEEYDLCSQLKIDKYAVYADNVIYGLNIFTKHENEFPDFCLSKDKFGENSFKSRAGELKKQLNVSKSKKVTVNNLEAEFIKDNFYNYWLINDFKNNQWFEIWTANSAENAKKVKDFVDSLTIGGVNKGIEIKEGADSNTGGWSQDFTKTKKPEKLTDENNGKFSNVLLVTKPQPKYTNTARRKNTQGTVLLRVTFLGHGGIGSVSPVRGLADGLTEQAVAAAKKIVFIPAKRNGENLSVTKTLQYTFTIY